MKKIFIFALATVGLTFASCGNKTESAATEDSLAIDTVAVVEDEAAPAEQLVSQLAEQLQAGDATEVETLISRAAAEIKKLIDAGNNEAAQAYAETVQKFISENADKLQGTNTATLVETIAAVPGTVQEAAVEAANDAVESAKAAAQQKADEAKAAAEKKVNEATEKAAQKATDAINNAASKIKL